jgi:hypothetical protein
MGRQVAGLNSTQEIARATTGHLGRDCETYRSTGLPEIDWQGVKKCQEGLNLSLSKRQLVDACPHVAVHDRPEYPGSI